MEDLEKVKNFSRAISDIKTEIRKDVVGQEEIVDSVITAIIAGGNVLLEGVPGVGKTRLVRSFLQGAFSALLAHSVHTRPHALGRNGHQRHRKGRRR